MKQIPELLSDSGCSDSHKNENLEHLPRNSQLIVPKKLEDGSRTMTLQPKIFDNKFHKKQLDSRKMTRLLKNAKIQPEK
jgi:hypothetical protein